METSRETHHEIVTPTSAFPASNDNLRSQLSFGRSLFPADAVARIFKPSRSVMTSGTARTKGWRLVFDRSRSPFIEPLMGYTGGHDTLTQVELEFPTLEAAIRRAAGPELRCAEAGGQAGQTAIGPTTEADVSCLLRHDAGAARPFGTSGQL